jgi:23S rRNA (uracil-5-)-methyltransferase RumA
MDMKKGEICEGVVTRVEFPNKGVVALSDRDAKVKGVIEGQKVRVRIKRARKENCQATLLEVIEQSPLENATPKCVHFGACGGCSYQTMSYENQLQRKCDMVEKLLHPFLEREGVAMENAQASPLAWGYRNKMEFSFGDAVKGGELCLGMHKKNSTYDVVNTDQCQIVHSDMTAVLETTVRHFQKTGNTFYKKMAHVGCLRHLVVRRSFANQALLVNLVTSTQETVDTDAYVAVLRELEQSGKLEGHIGGILWTKNDGLADVVKSDETVVLYGQDYIEEQILGLTFKISPFSFFQTNSKGAEVLYEKVREYVGDTKDKVIFDLYSGTGTIAQMLAPVAKKVIGVEIVGEACEAARENATLNGLDNCEFIAGDVLDVMDSIDVLPDSIVVDPPRDGLHPAALAKIMAYGVLEIVYISCKPTSLARDLELFEAGGYHMRRVGCVDMFPFTEGVETVALLQKSN